MNRLHHWLIPSAWILFAIYWSLSAGVVKRIKKAESRLERFIHLTLSSLAFVILFSPWFRAGPLGRRFLPQNQITFLTGALLLLAGLGFAVWARLHLGTNWSATVSLKEGHRLIQTGPYALVRHPIYTGIITAVTGNAVVLGEWRGLVAAALLMAVYFFKSRREERFLVSEFGEEYLCYQKRVKALIPFLV